MNILKDRPYSSAVLGNLGALRRYKICMGVFCTQVLSTGALKMFMSFLPTMLMAIISNVLTLKAGTWAQLKLQEPSQRFVIS